jgi:hypothetical protein
MPDTKWEAVDLLATASRLERLARRFPLLIRVHIDETVRLLREHAGMLMSPSQRTSRETGAVKAESANHSGRRNGRTSK